MSATWHGRAAVPTAAEGPRAATAGGLRQQQKKVLGPSAVTTLGPLAAVGTAARL